MHYYMSNAEYLLLCYDKAKLNSNIRMHIANNSIWLFSDKLLNLMWG